MGVQILCDALSINRNTLKKLKLSGNGIIGNVAEEGG
jgi:hypothetical protein